MKKRMMSLSLLAISISTIVNAEVNNNSINVSLDKASVDSKVLAEKQIKLPDNNVKKEVNPEYDNLEVQVVYNQPTASTIHGNYITKMETEIEYNDEGEATWSKVKYVLGEGTIRPQSWGNWFLAYHVAREDFFAGKPYSEQFEDGDVGNSIIEFQPHYVQNTDWGHWGINVGISHESISGGLFKPRIRPFGSYRITDNVEVFTSWMFFKEMFYKKGNTDNNILETDSSLTYHFDKGNVALGYFAKFGKNIDDDHSRNYDDGSSHTEFGHFSELTWKPRIHYRFDNGLGVTLYSEFGKYDNPTTHPAAGQTYDRYEEWYRKYGVFMEYPIRGDLILFGEGNYRKGRIKETYTDQSAYETRDRTNRFGMIGLNFLF
ncbi:OmpG porin family protein [Vibrio viridaestus]|uniref:Porin n=1 Tax=Vibrio viridaestus TaxID=2487322 RepID=A0A3N9TFL6_9VIBR|nr:OmpG porin family protein [Vibrio viridaestus]RQW62523.1 hypothetical protein EES38_12410 [Vibrio viridaestus]